MEWRLVGLPFSATFDGTCPVCPEPIERGDQVARQLDRNPHDPEVQERYVHSRCSGAPA